MTSGLTTRIPSSPSAHAQLGLERHAELAHHDDIQRRGQRPRHLQRDRDPPRGRPSTTTGSPRRCPSRAASRRPASSRSANTMTVPPGKLARRQGGPARDLGPELIAYGSTDSRGRDAVWKAGGENHGRPDEARASREAADIFDAFDKLFEGWALMPLWPMAFPSGGAPLT